jgi:hypothetical protein
MDLNQIRNYIGIGNIQQMLMTKVNLLTKNPTENSLTIWDYEVGYYKYNSKEKPIVDCLSYYPINDYITEHILNQEFIEFEYDNNNPKTINGKIIVLI